MSSPPLSQVAEQMLRESNNVIAENIARQLAIAMGLPATFGGAADAVMTELRRLGRDDADQPGGRQRAVAARRHRA